MESDGGEKVIGGVICGEDLNGVVAAPETPTVGERPKTLGQFNACNFDGINYDLKECSNEKKIFVGGLPPTLTVEEFKAYFEKFGTIEDVVVMSERETNRPRGFGFVTFDSVGAAKSVLQNRYYELKSKRVEVKPAVSKEGMWRNKWSNFCETYVAGLDFIKESTSRGYGNSIHHALPAFHGGLGGYFYRMNPSAFETYNGVGYYPYQSPNSSFQNSTFYGNAYPYQSSNYYYGNTYPYQYQSPNYYESTSFTVKPAYRNGWDHLCGKRRSVVVKPRLEVKDGSDSISNTATKDATLPTKFDSLNLGREEEGKEKRDSDNDHARPSGSREEASVLTCESDGETNAISDDKVPILICNGEGNTACAQVVDALRSSCSNGSVKEMGVEGYSSSCTAKSC